MPNTPKHVLGRFAQRTFDHLLHPHRKGAKARIPPRVQPKEAFVHPKDRIPLWNIGSGDRVRVISGDSKGQFGTVDWVDRHTNRVYLQEPEFARAKPVASPRKGAVFTDPTFQPEQKILAQKPIHYSNLQLVIKRSPEEEARAEARLKASNEGGSEASTSELPEVVAKRLRATNIHYDWTHKRWTWKRMAEGVSEVDPQTKHLSNVPWQNKEDLKVNITRAPPSYPREPARNDTPVSVAHENTFAAGSESERKLAGIRDFEFVNYYGRAQRGKRYNARKLEGALLSQEASHTAPRRRRSLILPEDSGLAIGQSPPLAG